MLNQQMNLYEYVDCLDFLVAQTHLERSCLVLESLEAASASDAGVPAAAIDGSAAVAADGILVEQELLVGSW